MFNPVRARLDFLVVQEVKKSTQVKSINVTIEFWGVSSEGITNTFLFAAVNYEAKNAFVCTTPIHDKNVKINFELNFSCLGYLLLRSGGVNHYRKDLAGRVARFSSPGQLPPFRKPRVEFK